ncbi:MAG: hypothetical protein OXB84_02505 [Halobacteriovoraceae bacterium]|nr:hypothetical protein [Halobacteriovoraceae bacterium]
MVKTIMDFEVNFTESMSCFFDNKGIQLDDIIHSLTEKKLLDRKV